MYNKIKDLWRNNIEMSLDDHIKDGGYRIYFYSKERYRGYIYDGILSISKLLKTDEEWRENSSTYSTYHLQLADKLSELKSKLEWENDRYDIFCINTDSNYYKIIDDITGVNLNRISDYL